MGCRRDARGPPTIALRELLEDARARGERFDVAWAAALPAALEHARGSLAARGWTDALSATRDAWEAAYERRPLTPASRGAVAILRHHALMGGSAVDLPARRARYVA